MNNQQVLDEIDPEQTTFMCVGVPDVVGLQAVTKILDQFDIVYQVFYNPKLDGEPTSVAVYPIAENNRNILMAFNSLRFDRT